MLNNDTKRLFCDVYLTSEVKGGDLQKCILSQYLNFDIETDKTYGPGYLGLNIKRLAGLMVVMRLKDVVKVDAYNVPIKYRDCPNLSLNEAKLIADKMDRSDGRKAIYPATGYRYHPMYWSFGLTRGHGVEMAGGSIYIDRIDGHIWSSDEMDEYLHDYNNAFWVM